MFLPRRRPGDVYIGFARAVGPVNLAVPEILESGCSRALADGSADGKLGMASLAAWCRVPRLPALDTACTALALRAGAKIVPGRLVVLVVNGSWTLRDISSAGCRRVHGIGASKEIFEGIEPNIMPVLGGASNLHLALGG